MVRKEEKLMPIKTAQCKALARAGAHQTMKQLPSSAAQEASHCSWMP